MNEAPFWFQAAFYAIAALAIYIVGGTIIMVAWTFAVHPLTINQWLDKKAGISRGT
jgi:hypothetical protein